MLKRFIILILVIIVSINSYADRFIVFLKNSEDFVSRSDNRLIQKKEIFDNSINNMDLLNNRRISIVGKLYSVNAIIVECDRNDLINKEYIRYFVPDRMEKPEKGIDVKVDSIDRSENTWNLEMMNIPDIWKKYGYKGKGITIGIIDTGLDIKHPEFADRPNVKMAWSYGEKISIDQLTDGGGHGSHVAGIIAGGKASGQNIGVAPECDLIIAKAIGGKEVRASTLLSAMEFMLDPDGDPYTDDMPAAVNCSWHSSFDYQPPYFDMIETWAEFNIVPCFSAGNSGPSEKTITKPKEHPQSFATGAVGKDKEVCKFSSRGPGVYNGIFTEKPDWTAPGQNILSIQANGTYVEKQGTSMASPHITGLVALMKQSRNNLTNEDIRCILRKSAGNDGKLNEFNTKDGYGLVNGLKAIDILEDGSVIQIITNNIENVKIHIEEDNRDVLSNNTGKGSFFAQSGSYNLKISANGYFDKNLAIDVSKKNDQVIHVDLVKNNIFSFTGNVKSGYENIENVKIVISNNENFKKEIYTDNKGNYSIDIPSGIYNVMYYSKGYKTVIEKDFEIDSQINLDIEMKKALSILLVDNDGEKDFEKSYTDCFDQSNIDYYVLQLKDGEDILLEDLLSYNNIVWIMGNNLGNRITENNRNTLRKFKEIGGSLLMAGQDVAIGLRRGIDESDFMNNVLKSSYYDDKPEKFNVYDENILFTLNKLPGNFNQNSPDVISNINNSESIFRYEDPDRSAGNFYQDETFRMVFLPFTLARVTDKESRVYIVKKCLSLLDSDINRKFQTYSYIKLNYPEYTEVYKDYLLNRLNKERELLDENTLRSLPYELREAVLK